MEKIKNLVSEIIEDKFYIEKSEIDWHEPLEYVPLDDLEVCELMCEIERMCNIMIPDETCESFKNLDEIVKYLDARGVFKS